VVQVAAQGRDDRLIVAAKEQDVATVRDLLRQAVDVNTRQADGATALHWAAHWDDVSTAKLLVEAGADVDAANGYGVTPLLLACTNASVAMVQTLLAAGADPNQPRATGEAPVMTCARTGNVETVKALLTRGADVNVKESSRGQTALMWAIAEGHRQVVRLLVQHGADVRTASTGGFTPLLFAAREGDAESARELLAAGADLNEVSPDGSTPLLMATLRGHVPLALWLLEKGADPNASGTGYTALHWAAGSWRTQLTGPFGIVSDRDPEWRAMGGLPSDKLTLVKALLDHGADPNVRLTKEPPQYGFSNARFKVSLRGATPFFLAALAADVEVMRVLAAYGAHTTRGTEERIAAEGGGSIERAGSTTPLMAAAGIGRVPNESFITEAQTLEAVKLALELGGDVNATNAGGDTALHGAAHIRSARLVQLLVERGASVNVRNKLGFTPLQVAEGSGHSENPGLGLGGETGALLRKLGGQ
jgi:ankyrin repeat protein